MSKKIGILALQGNFAEHKTAVEKHGAIGKLVKLPHELAGLDGLIIPGGESTALLKLMSPWNWQGAIKQFASSGKAIFGTCAGMILLANKVEPSQECLGLIDITVSRNAYGRQIESFTDIASLPQNTQKSNQTTSISQKGIETKGYVTNTLSKKLNIESLTMPFIRAPRLIAHDDTVTVLATHENTPVLLQQNNILVAAFHPELCDVSPVHEYFIKQVLTVSCKTS